MKGKTQRSAGDASNPPAPRPYHDSIIATPNNAIVKEFLLSLLLDLELVEQSGRHHPEGNALYHSLQVFQLAVEACSDPPLWCAALLHDIGKSQNYRQHHVVGAELVTGLLSPRITWLIRNHMALLRSPAKTRRYLQNTPYLHELELLRRYDTQGRKTDAVVIPVEEALDILFEHPEISCLSPTDSFYIRPDCTFECQLT